MKITVVHGQNHKGSTYHITKMLTDQIGGTVHEFFLPDAFGSFCAGCSQCFEVSETRCPHYRQLAPVTTALREADVIILESPVYVYHCTGPMKAFLEHYGYQWMVHRPDPSMFSKQGICLSTAAGAGTKSTCKDMADSLFFWGVGRIETVGFSLHALRWSQVSETQKRTIEQRMHRLAARVRTHQGRVHLSVKTKAFFRLMRKLHRRGFNGVDDQYWKTQGWLNGQLPW